MQNMPATNRISRHHRHHRLGAVPNLPLEVEDIETQVPGVAVFVARIPPDALVSSGAERLLSSTREDDRSRVCVFTRFVEGVDHFPHCQGSKGVAHLRTVNSDFGDALSGLVVEDVSVISGGGPVVFEHDVF